MHTLSLLLLAAYAAAQSCVNFSMPSVWPAAARAPRPPWAALSIRSGGTIDAVLLTVPGNTFGGASNLTTRLGGSGGGGGIFNMSCPGGFIIGFGYELEGT